MKTKIDIIDDLSIEINVNWNPYNFKLEDLFVMAARINKKRQFLFVSKVLGKHYPVTPTTAIHVGQLLGHEYYYQKMHLDRKTNTVQEPLVLKEESIVLKEETLFIGFAETATALGHIVFDCFTGKCSYIHTTREILGDYENPIQFKEEHSHATDHHVYPVDFNPLVTSKEIVLVDDEITTGNTCLNIIKEIHKDYPKEVYNVLTILDWRNEASKAKFLELEKQLGIKINVVSIMAGDFIIEGKIKEKEALPMVDKKVHNNDINNYYIDDILNQRLEFQDTNGQKKSYIKHTGRFGIKSDEQEVLRKKLKKAGTLLKTERRGKATLLLGTGEFMYMPMVIGGHMGSGIKFQSCTRSPIYPLDRTDYGAANKYEFKSYYDQALMKYFYNIKENQYDEIFIFFEGRYTAEAMESFKTAIAQTGIKYVNFVWC